MIIRYIYCLKDDSKKVGYVGITNNLRRRLQEHWSGRNRGNTPKDAWLRSMKKKPTIEIIDLVYFNSWWRTKEMLHILYWRFIKRSKLTNQQKSILDLFKCIILDIQGKDF